MASPRPFHSGPAMPAPGARRQPGLGSLLNGRRRPHGGFGSGGYGGEFSMPGSAPPARRVYHDGRGGIRVAERPGAGTRASASREDRELSESRAYHIGRGGGPFSGAGSGRPAPGEPSKPKGAPTGSSSPGGHGGQGTAQKGPRPKSVR